MKIRNHRHFSYLFIPSTMSKLKPFRREFKHKSALMRFLTANLSETANGIVHKYESCFDHYGVIRSWVVWYNQNEYHSGASLKAQLRQLYFRGRKFNHRPSKIDKWSKRRFAFNHGIHNKMQAMSKHKDITERDAQILISLFHKSGFKDFEPTAEDWVYINGHIGDGIDFDHWSDRLDCLRMKTIIECFKTAGLV